MIPDLPEYKGVIAISFTNKASDELKRRCKQRCADTKQSFFGTIDKFYISQIIIPFSSHVTGNITEYEIVDNIDESSKYVGLTRAKDACYIMNGTARFRSKKNDYIFAEPSSFLSKPGLAERRKDVRWEM